MDVNAYLRRINYSGPLAPTAETLGRLHEAHLLAVPFENLSIHWGQPILLDDEALFDKVVMRRRGGFCYELNGLFAALLRALGFDVVMLSAGVATADGGFGPDFDHMALLVTLEQRWLADVGFGDSFRRPLLLDEEGEQEQAGRAYRLLKDGDHLILAQRDSEGVWEHQYRFTLRPHVYADYAGMCLYHQTSPQSHFTQKPVCTLATPRGRVTLSGMRLITTEEGRRQERMLIDDAEYAATLRQYFGIHPPSQLSPRG
jgi:N-hydroxyarylamine O-acetyltransferase